MAELGLLLVNRRGRSTGYSQHSPLVLGCGVWNTESLTVILTSEI